MPQVGPELDLLHLFITGTAVNFVDNQHIM